MNPTPEEVGRRLRHPFITAEEVKELLGLDYLPKHLVISDDDTRVAVVGGNTPRFSMMKCPGHLILDRQELREKGVMDLWHPTWCRESCSIWFVKVDRPIQGGPDWRQG